jgi:hypothetical protein
MCGVRFNAGENSIEHAIAGLRFAFADGDITGIEIADGQIRLVRWSALVDDGVSRRVVRQASLEELFAER